VLVLRGQSLTPAQFVAFARRLGPPQPHVIDQFHHPADSNILILSNVKKDGKPTGCRTRFVLPHRLLLPAGAGTRDHALFDRPPEEGRRYAVREPAGGLRRLADAMKRRIEPLYGIITTATATIPMSAVARPPRPHRGTEGEDAAHHAQDRAPHPVPGAKSLYAVNGSSFGIVGMPEDEALGLLDELAAHSTHPKYQYSLKYGVGDVVIWDNASLLHSATLIDPDDARTLWRITVLEPARSAWRRK
jgi:taurine dioxygenase